MDNVNRRQARQTSSAGASDLSGSDDMRLGQDASIVQPPRSNFQGAADRLRQRIAPSSNDHTRNVRPRISHASHAPQPSRTGSSARTVPTMTSDPALDASLINWVNSASSLVECDSRRTAAQRIYQAFNHDDAVLDLTGLKLTSIPDCMGKLGALQTLHLGANRLTSLPPLPNALQHLDLSNNALSNGVVLPPQLQVLDVTGNTAIALTPEQNRAAQRFQQFAASYTTPSTFAATWGVLSMDHDHAGLMRFNAIVAATQLAVEPIDHSVVSADQNAVTDVAADAITDAQMAEYFIFGNEVPAVAPPEFTVEETTAQLQAWQPPQLRADVALQASWPGIANEEHASNFAVFLKALSGTAEYTNLQARQGLTHQVGELLQAMSASPEFRKTCFTIAFDASTTCHDRVTLSLSDMSLALINHHAEQGRYTDKDLLDLGRGLFRLHALDKIADETIIEQERQFALDPSRHFKVDPVEVRLAYHTQLAAKLALPGVARDMKYAYDAHLQSNALDMAERRIREMSDSGEDVEYLATWSPWENLIKNHYPQKCASFDEEVGKDRDWLVFRPPAMNSAQYMRQGQKQQEKEVNDRRHFMVKMTWNYLSEGLAG